jgi:hypothetical protein
MGQEPSVLVPFNIPSLSIELFHRIFTILESVVIDDAKHCKIAMKGNL